MLDLSSRGGFLFPFFSPLSCLRTITPAFKRKAATIQATTWVKPEDIIVSSMSQAQKDKYIWLPSYDGAEVLSPHSQSGMVCGEGWGQRAMERCLVRSKLSIFQRWKLFGTKTKMVKTAWRGKQLRRNLVLDSGLHIHMHPHTWTLVYTHEHIYTYKQIDGWMRWIQLK